MRLYYICVIEDCVPTNSQGHETISNTTIFTVSSMNDIDLTNKCNDLSFI